MNDEQMFARAVQLSGDERIQFIAQSCGQDPEQRERMEKLLAAHETPDSLLSVDGISSTTAYVNDDSVGQQIGPYKLLQELGEGGMGTVYLAERQHPVKQRVALKIIKHGMDSKRFIARFEAERQALAMMDHPNIASVHDADCTQSGRPYLVMELVKGVPITTFCDQNKLSTRERLELFIPVCNAVQHAHQKGIIHRDLKPSNILVALYDDRPVPKVIDFGLAKAANQQLTDKTLFTEVGSILGTWEYMSPEQAVLNQLDVDTRTDVYALGVILYELLTGVTPLDRKQLREVQLRETLRIIQEVDPPKPSTRVSGLDAAVSAVASYRSTDAAGLSKAIHGDLDWVTMKALEKDRRRRYEAASRLADDVAHVLAGEAVDARPPSLAYTTSKLWNRHKLPISTAALILCSLVIASIVTSSLWLQGRRLTERLSDKNETLETQGKELSASREIARESLYAFSIESAFQSWEMGSLERLEELLHQCVPQSEDDEDLRGFEWRLLNQRILDSRPAHTFKCSSVVNDVDFSPDGKGLVGGLENGGVFVVSLDSKRSNTQGIEVHPSSESGDSRPVTHVVFVDNDRVATRAGESGEKDWSFCVSSLNEDWTEFDVEQELRIEKTASNLWRTKLGDVMFKAGGDSAGYRISAEEPVFAGETFETPSVQATAGDLYANLQVTARKLRVFRHSTGEQIMEIPVGPQPRAVSFTSTADRLFASDSTGTWSLRINNGIVSKSKKRISWRRSSDTLAIPKSNWVALAGSDDATVTIYDYARGETVARFLHLDRVYSLAISKNGRWLASGSRDQLIKIWDLNALRQRTHRGAPNYFAPLAVRGNGGAVAFLSSAKSITLYEVDRGKSTEFSIEEVDDVFSHAGGIRGLSLAPDGNHLAAACYDGSVVIWNTASPDEPRRIKVSQYVRSVAFSPNGESLAIGSSGSLSLMQMSNDVFSEIERVSAGTFDAAVFSHDGKYLAYGRTAHIKLPAEAYGNRFARVWNVDSTPKRHHQYAYPGGIQCVEFSPDNRFVAIAGSTDLVKVYELDTHQEVATLLGNGSWLTSVSFSSDGKTIAASSPAGEIKFWQVPTFKPAGSMKVERGLRRIKFGGDGNTLFWSSMDGRLGYYRASPTSVLDTSQ